jgi:hypothetical protein
MVTDGQVRTLRTELRNGKTQEAAAAAAGISERSARQWRAGPYPSRARKPHLWRTRPDPFDGVFESEIAPLLAADEKGRLKGGAILIELYRRHPGRFSARHLRTLQRRIREWGTHHRPEVHLPPKHSRGRGALPQLDYRVLARTGVLASLSTRELEALAAVCTVERIVAGTILPDHDGPVILLHGAVRVFEMHPGGRRRVTRIAGRGSIFGSFPWSTLPHQAMVDSTVAKLTHEQFARAVCGISFEVLRPVFEVLVKRPLDQLVPVFQSARLPVTAATCRRNSLLGAAVRRTRRSRYSNPATGHQC